MGENDSQNSITEQYISVHALPNEQINSWVKWRKDLDFEFLILRTEADISINRFLNVSEEVYSANQSGSFAGKFQIDKKWIQADGFFGFQGYYTKIPDEERRVYFYIDFMSHNKKIQQVELSLDIIIPKIKFKTVSQNEIILKEPQNKFTLQSKLEKTGRANAKNMSGFIEVVRGGKDIEISISSRRTSERDEFTFPYPVFRQEITVTGTGYALVRLGYDYEDYADNKYRTDTIEFVFDKRIEEKSQIPVESNLEEMSQFW